MSEDNYKPDELVSTIKHSNDQNEFVSKKEFEFRLSEICKCKKDVTYFANKYFKVLTLDKGIIQIKLYPKQEKFLKFIHENNRVICKSARQSSKTTTYIIYALWYTIFNPNKKIMICANKYATALEFIARIQRGYEYLPRFIKPAVAVWNRSSVVFANGSSIVGFSSSSSTARGFSGNIVILDEFAFLPKHIADQLFTSIFPTISSSKEGKIIIVSTPDGEDNLYWKILQQAIFDKNNEDGWKAFVMNWWDVPGRDEHFKQAMIASIGQERWEKEFECSVCSSSTSTKLVPSDILDKLRKKLEVDLKENPGHPQTFENPESKKIYEFMVWEVFDPNKTYLAGGDCSEGLGQDDSVLYVWDISDMGDIRQCASFISSKVSPVEFAYITNKILRLYGSPYYVCERNGIGSGYLDALKVIYKYENLIAEGKKGEMGIYANASTKTKAFNWVREMITTADIYGFSIKDKNLFEELDTFTKEKENNSRKKSQFSLYRAYGNAHDDRVMAWVWAMQILDPTVIERYYICCTNKKSMFNKFYPKYVKPQSEYANEDIASIFNDPIYLDFIQFRNDLIQKSEALKQQEEIENQKDPFYCMQAQKPREIYFSDEIYPHHLNETKFPSFSINLCNGFDDDSLFGL